MAKTVYAPATATATLPIITRSERVNTESSVQDLVAETSRLVASATHLVFAIEKNAATVAAMITPLPLLR